jgi:hypothetical protein
MKLLIDVEHDATLIRQRLGDVLPEVQDDALALARTLAGRWQSGGLSAANVAAAFHQTATELEQQVAAAVTEPPA